MTCEQASAIWTLIGIIVGFGLSTIFGIKWIWDYTYHQFERRRLGKDIQRWREGQEAFEKEMEEIDKLLEEIKESK